MKLCECGCGETTLVARQSDALRGHVKGQPYRFIVGHNGKMRPRKSGYHVRYVPSHPRASSAGDVYVHVLVAEAALGHYLPDGAQIHHVDENKRNNANRNLVICQDKAYHKLLHYRARIVRFGGDPNTQRICSFCVQLLPFASFNRCNGNVGTGLQTACRVCMERKRIARKAAQRTV